LGARPSSPATLTINFSFDICCPSDRLQLLRPDDRLPRDQLVLRHPGPRVGIAIPDRVQRRPPFLGGHTEQEDPATPRLLRPRRQQDAPLVELPQVRTMLLLMHQ